MKTIVVSNPEAYKHAILSALLVNGLTMGNNKKIKKIIKDNPEIESFFVESTHFLGIFMVMVGLDEYLKVQNALANDHAMFKTWMTERANFLKNIVLNLK